MKNLLTHTTLSLLLLLGGCSESSTLYKDASQPIEKRVENLLEQMTLEEKLEQLNLLILGKNTNINNLESGNANNKLSPLTGGYIYSGTSATDANELQRYAMEESRLGIPVLLGNDVIRGFRTLFPMPLAQACSWNPELSHQSCRIAAKESWLSGVRWTFSPMIDVARDGRWGRVAESYGEDPYTNCVFAEAAVRGYQGDALSDKYSIASCLKHFAGYSYSQGGRDYHPTDVSNLSLWETVLPPYQAAVKAGAATVMSSFNDLNGVPLVANHYMLTEVLRDRLGFDGFVVSDWRAVEQLFNQRFVTDSIDAAVKSIAAGNDMDMYDAIYRDYLPQALQQGRIDMATIDNAVRRVLKLKFELGLFETPYVEVVPDSDRYFAPASIALSKQMAEESMVLLKNKNHLLPFDKGIKNILLVGVMANDRNNYIGTWTCNGENKDVVTIYEGLQKEFGNRARITHLEGTGFLENIPAFEKALAREARKADVIVIALGEQRYWSGENGSKASLALPAAQEQLVVDAYKSNKPVVLLTSSGRPLALSNIEPYADAIVQMWQSGLYGGDAVAGILSGRVNPSGRLAITFPYTTGQLPIFYNHRENARGSWTSKQGGYADAPSTPLYEFGHGLSYSTFEYSNLAVSQSHFTKEDKIVATIEVTNSSDVDGMETLFWYVDDAVASISQPVKKLKHFEKQLVKGNETVQYTFEIDPMRDLSFVDANGNMHLEKGDFYIIVKDKRICITLK